MGRLEVETYEDGETVRYAYDNSGNLATVTDSATGVVTTYYYDLLNRQSGYREQGTNYDHSVVYTYDAENNLSSMTEVINGVTKTYSYTYNEDNQLISETVDGITVEYTYDGFGRLEERVVKNGTTEIYSIEPSYSAGTTANSTSTQVTGYNGFTYTYDDNGNILSVSDGTNTTNYQYDSQNQLIRENNQAQGYTHTWTYNNAGNIVERNEYAYTLSEELDIADAIDSVSYNYQDTYGWGDLLTSYDGRTITYDEIGNPLSDGEWTYTWKRGRQLASMTKGSTTWTYTYDADGLRTKRTNGIYGSTYTYVYNGSSLAMMTKGNNKLSFSYNATGTPLAVQYNGTTYYYKTNLQGDVMGIVNSNGTAVVTYAYNAWGVLLACTGSMAGTLGALNPLRYRGYVYDTETGLYYLQSRYYNPEWGRFINADIFYSTGQGFTGNNMFAYCLNNPVNMVDHDGEDAIYVTDKKLGRGLPVVGHAILYIQDSNGEWYITDYIGVFPDKSTATIRFDPADMDIVNSMLNNERLPHINYVHLEGDFSASITTAEQYEGTNYNGYNLLNNNCKDYTQEILGQGTYDNVFESMVVNNSNAMAPAKFGIQLSFASQLSNAWNRAKNFAGGLWDEFTSWLK